MLEREGDIDVPAEVHLAAVDGVDALAQTLECVRIICLSKVGPEMSRRQAEVGRNAGPGGVVFARQFVALDLLASVRVGGGLEPVADVGGGASEQETIEVRIELARMIDHAKRLFARLGCRDYGRFDFRCAADGEPRLLEVNPNPAWANDGKLAFMAGFAGLAYADMLKMILDAALART